MLCESQHLDTMQRAAPTDAALFLHGGSMKRHLKGVIVASIVSAASAAFLVSIPTSGAMATGTPPVKGTCMPTKIAFVASTASANNSTATYINVPESLVYFVQGGTKPSCVIVQFFASENANGTGLYLRAMLDGVTPGLPNEAPVARDSDPYSHSVAGTFIFNAVAPGAHNIKLQFHTSGNANGIIGGPYNIIVSYAP
jgi:hypothetical protein